MQQNKQAAKSANPSPKPQVSRVDRKTAEIVRKGITLQQIHGTEYAAQFLREKSIDVEVAMRVLLNYSAMRRHEDFQEIPITIHSGRRI